MVIIGKLKIMDSYRIIVISCSVICMFIFLVVVCVRVV